MLVIEGPDGVGKTTFARKCVKWFEEKRPVIYQHFSRLPKAWDYYRSYLPYVNRYTVQDRFHMSEIAYGLGARDGTQIRAETLRLLDAHLDLVGSYTVLIVPYDAKAATWFYERSPASQMFSLPQVLAVTDQFQAIADQTGEMLPRYDLCVRLREGQYPSDDLADSVCRAWDARLDFMETIR